MMGWRVERTWQRKHGRIDATNTKSDDDDDDGGGGGDGDGDADDDDDDDDEHDEHDDVLVHDNILWWYYTWLIDID